MLSGGCWGGGRGVRCELTGRASALGHLPAVHQRSISQLQLPPQGPHVSWGREGAPATHPAPPQLTEVGYAPTPCCAGHRHNSLWAHPAPCSARQQAPCSQAPCHRSSKGSRYTPNRGGALTTDNHLVLDAWTPKSLLWSALGQHGCPDDPGAALRRTARPGHG